MGMQTDVLCGHIHQSGFIVEQYPSRVKALSVRGAAAAGEFALFSTLTAPVAASYAQAGSVVTVTSNAHGLVTGQIIGISYQSGSGGAATSGNYAITRTGANTFTIVSPNPNTVAANAPCDYVVNGTWLVTLDLAAGDAFQNYFLLPGEGIRSNLKVYALMINITTATVFYG
jgi:hypothetical protein